MTSIQSKPSFVQPPVTPPTPQVGAAAAAGAVAGAAAAAISSLNPQDTPAKTPASMSLSQDAAGPIQESQLRGAISALVKNNNPDDVGELKEMVLSQAEKMFGKDSAESNKIIDKLFIDTKSSQKYEKMLGDALKEFKNISQDPAKAEAALKKLSEFVAKGARGLANGEDDPGC